MKRTPDKILVFERFTFEIECDKADAPDQIEAVGSALSVPPEVEDLKNGRVCIRYVIQDREQQARMSEVLKSMGAKQTTYEVEDTSTHQLN
jgi:hypothetical protein